MNILNVLTFFLVIGTVLARCVLEPIEMVVFNNILSMSETQRNQSESLVRDIASYLLEDSTIHVNLLSNIVKEKISLHKTSDNSSWIRNISFVNHAETTTKFSNTISSAAIDTELESRFSVNKYKSRAEFVVLLLSDETKLDTVSQFLQKKKTFVVVFGLSIPEKFKSVASRDDYLYQVGNTDDLEEVTKNITERIACDSDQYCDTDEFNLGKGNKCNSCTPYCLQNTDTCYIRCPFVNGGESEHTVGVEQVLEDKKTVVSLAIVGAIGTIAGVIIVVLIYCWLDRCRNNQNESTNSENVLQKRPEHQLHMNDKFPVPVSGAEEDIEPFIEETVADEETTPKNVDKLDKVSENGGDKIVLDFANNRELELNLLGDKVQYKPVHY